MQHDLLEPENVEYLIQILSVPSCVVRRRGVRPLDVRIASDAGARKYVQLR